MAVFTWTPMTQPEGTVRLRVRRAQFGDGYSQLAGDGLNVKATDWNVTFEGTYAEVKAIEDFLDAQQGYIMFQWTPPGAAASYWYTCTDYRIVPHIGLQKRLTGTFKQEFQP